MSRTIKFTDRYEIYSVYPNGKKSSAWFLEDSADDLAKAQKLAKKHNKTHPVVKLVDTLAVEEDLEASLNEELRAAAEEAWHEGFCRGEQSGLRELPLNPREWNPYRKDNT